MNNITKVLNQIKKHCPKSATLPILQNVLLELEDGILRLTTTNLNSTASVAIPNVGNNMRITSNLKTLEKVVASMGDPISFELDVKERKETRQVYNADTNTREPQDVIVTVSKLVVSDSGTRAVLETIDADEFPLRAEKGELLGEIDLAGVERVYPFAGCDSSRPVLECVLFELHSGRVIAADGFKLAVLRKGIKPAFPERNLLISADALSKLPRGAVKANLFLGKDTATLEFNTGFTLIARIPEGIFPDYEQSIPKHFNSEFTANVEQWLNAVKGVKVFADDTYGITRHSITGNTMTVSAKDGEGNVIQKELPATKTGAYPVFTLNNKHLTTTLKACVSDEVVVKLTMPELPETQYEVTPSTKPIVIEDGNWLAAIMPMHDFQGREKGD